MQTDQRKFAFPKQNNFSQLRSSEGKNVRVDQQHLSIKAMFSLDYSWEKVNYAQRISMKLTPIEDLIHTRHFYSRNTTSKTSPKKIDIWSSTFEQFLFAKIFT